MTQKTKLFVTILLTTLLLSTALNYFIISANAQNNATVVVLDSVGGTVEPSGANTYPDGSSVELTATPTDSSFVFSYWVISTNAGDAIIMENPHTLSIVGGETYAVQAVFQPLQAPPGNTLPTNLTAAAIVIVLTSAGGSVSPPPGTYALQDARSFLLTATPKQGWTFSHWVISGENTDHGGAPANLTPTNNPYDVNHGYGYTYSYQAVFTPVSGGGPTPTPTTSPAGPIGGMSTETWIIIALAIVIIVMLIGFAVAYSRKK